jgi:group II intron reverse transcriptase/maturase
MINSCKTNKKSTIGDKMSTINLRYVEYYNQQYIHDTLYKRSKEDNEFRHIFNLIIYPNNILLAYRLMKSNSGSNTPGEDGLTIKDLAKLTESDIINHIQTSFKNYMPRKVRRVEIPKSNGTMRKLGIPSIWDRLMQQCIKNSLEPICEAKFHHHSFGFRPNRSCEHAMLGVCYKINRSQMLYCVDIDIKSFFDKIDHNKLIKQLWAMGIHDKRLISIIKCMLKAEVVNEGFPTEGTPQGGILSPLLANVVLNELDWWISDQWETFNTKKRSYKQIVKDNNGKVKYVTYSNKYASLRTTNLKEGYIIRYADDFKIMCRTEDHANRFYHAIRLWLKERLKLDINEEKSKVTDLTKTYTEFLGFKIRAVKKNSKYVAYTSLTDKSIDKILESARKTIKLFKHVKDINILHKILWKWNLQIQGWHNYYKIATHCIVDFSKIHYKLLRSIQNICANYYSKEGNKELLETDMFKNYKNSKQIRFIGNSPMLPIGYVQHRYPMGFKVGTCNYTIDGREEVYKSLDALIFQEIRSMVNKYNENNSIEYFDNRISKYSMQKGKCLITGQFLVSSEVHCHHILPKELGGTDEFKNLICIHEDVHRLIHLTDESKLDSYINKLKLNQKHIDKINKFREVIGHPIILL